ncbi:MAG: substrate-binding domain-containing protein [Roseibium sp.]|uniref:LacI family DNA-binding transcriptional regulator n=1 Tax=Roseibium sp. TaxID=1936156 RepID=UPI001B1F24E6|nr:substrate-binding domain-containing protein [Roseibium sp.]MBO6510512.1 substrate-binding domain-containing protein [Roseibium sp.]MBO6892768.1 substrate-binding domain-containing protein [Roseibium sp.]MBO6928512.1 substrate-binding domain-containing protein [Roseibium sp.]
MSKGVNLKELSKKLNLSQTTVSRALNGYPEVSADTRKRVAEMAEALGYAPNSQARRLATGRSMAIGHVIPRSIHEMMNPIFLEFIAGAGETYSKHGYDMIISVVEDDHEEDAYRQIASRKKADGVIVHGPASDEHRHELLKELNLPFVVHGRIPGAEEETSWIDMNNRRAFERATNLLLDLGHTRIALLNGLEQMDFAKRRRRGFESALEARGHVADPDLMRSSDMTEPFGCENAMEMLKSDNPPTAFLVSSMITAIGVARAVGQCGLQTGKDVSIITHDDALSFLPNSGEIPIFTCTRSSVRFAGQKAAELLLNMIANPGGKPTSLHLDAELIVGQSTGPAPSR